MNFHQQRIALTLPVANYSPAIAKAVAWLGERYLLARPVQAVHPFQGPRGHVDAAPATIHYARRT